MDRDSDLVGTEATPAGLATLRADLERIAADPARRVYAVVDGALFDDLPTRLSVSGLAYRSTWCDVEDYDVMAAAPFLIDPYVMPHLFLPTAGEAGSRGAAREAPGSEEPAEATGTPYPANPVIQLGIVCDVIAPCPNGAVFWIGTRSLTAERMFKQARSLNRVLIPRAFAGDAFAGGPAFGADVGETASADADPGRTHTDVMFRHGDGNVLAEVLPVLGAAQFTRLFGPARAVTFLAPGHPSPSSGSPLRRALRPADAPAPPAGLLRLDEAQMEGVEEARASSFRAEIAAHLREVAGDELVEVNDEALGAMSARYDRSGDAFGFEWTRSYLNWAYVNAVTGDYFEVHKNEWVDHFALHSGGPDMAMDELMGEFVAAFEEAWDDEHGRGS